MLVTLTTDMVLLWKISIVWVSSYVNLAVVARVGGTASADKAPQAPIEANSYLRADSTAAPAPLVALELLHPLQELLARDTSRPPHVGRANMLWRIPC